MGTCMPYRVRTIKYMYEFVLVRLLGTADLLMQHRNGECGHRTCVGSGALVDLAPLLRSAPSADNDKPLP